MQSALKNLYQEFFKNFKINKKTGYFKNNHKIKFPTYPYIGSKYGRYKKILIIGLDIGSDEKKGIQSFEARRKAIENKPVSRHNPHIAGTYFTALFFLKEALCYEKYWNKLKNTPSCKQALQIPKKLPISNPLSYIALTNYYKFVSINRINRTGGENRQYIDKKIELDLFIKEIKIFNPDIIIFQSTSFKHKKILLKKLLGMGRSIYIGPHPAYRGDRQPDYFINQISKI